MSSWLVDPVFNNGQWIAFGVLMIISVLVTLAFSPVRRRMLGWPTLALATAVRIAPGVGAITVVRSAYRLGYRAEGYGFWDASLRSLVWMVGASILGGLIVKLVPPTSWLLAKTKRCEKDIWMGRWERFLARGGRA